MPKATWLQTNFNGGEWSPLAGGRVDLAKYRNGMAECLDYFPTQQGGLTRRPGTRYAAAVKDSTYAPRPVRFEFSIIQAYVLEFGNNYIRFFTNDGQLLSGGAPYEVTTTYTSAEVWDLDFAQSADTLYIAHPNHPPMKLQRAGATSWTLTAISFLDGPYLSVNTTSTTLTPAATTGTTAVVANSLTGINGGAGFRASDVGRMLRIKCGGSWLWGTIATVSDTTHITWTILSNGGSAPRTATATANVSSGSIFGVTVTDGGSGYGAQPPSVTINSHNTDPATATLTVVAGVITAINLTHAGSGYTSSLFGSYIPITVSGSGGTGLQAVASILAGAVNGIVLTSGGTGYAATDAVAFVGGAAGGSGAVAYATVADGVVTGITVSVTGTGYGTAADVFLSSPTAVVPSTTTFWRLGEWNSTDGYPAAVTFHQDRLIWGGAASTPGRIDGSNSGDYENYAPTRLDGTVVDSNALAFSLNAGTVNVIQWLMSDEWGLLVGTSGGEWAVSPSTAQTAITPTNVNAKPLGNYGSSSTQPVRVGKAILFIQRTTRKVREMVYQFMVNTFQALDISLVAEHLTKSGIKQMAVQFAPQQIVWIARTDGRLVGMTYDKDQDICGWHQHSLGGYSDAAQTLPPLVEGVAVIPAPGAQRDEVWLVVKRYINGATVRSFEVMAKMWEDGDATSTCVFMDCSAEYNGAPTTAITGLTWLKGQTVGVLTDGAVHPDALVDSSGSITLVRSASIVQVGLKYKSRGVTLRPEAGGADGPSQGKLKRVHRAVVRFFQSIGLSMGSSSAGVTSYPEPFRTSADPMSGPVGLFDGDKRWSYEGTWGTDGQIVFETDDPLPSNITMLMAQLETNDDL